MKPIKRKKTGLLFSGGKDSCLALFKARQQGYEIACLLSIIPENRDSWMFHKPSLALLKKQAEMLGLPLIIQKTPGEKDKEVEDLEKLILKVKGKINGLVVGGVASNYQKKRVENICNKFGLELIAPLWGYKGEDLWKELFDNNFVVAITKVSCEGLGKEWLGKTINRTNFKELKRLAEKYRFNLSGEGGEFETLVLDCPLFDKKLKIVKGRIVWKRNSGYYVIEEIKQPNTEEGVYY